MNFIKNGKTVKMLGTEMKATIIGVCIRGIDNCTIEYQIQWMNQSGIQDEWVYNYQVEEYVDTSRPAGMVNYETGVEKV